MTYIDLEKLINDKNFEVQICSLGSSPSPEKAIWKGQNICVNENARNVAIPSNAGEAVIKHQLRVDHWSVLDQAFLRLECFGFPHCVTNQITRHHESYPLVQSMRYTGDRFLEFAKGDDVLIDSQIEKLIYFRPVGEYCDRGGRKYFYSQEDRQKDIDQAVLSITEYIDRIEKGQPYEMARSRLQYDFRQDFCIAGTVRKVFHWLDQRTKRDAQLEVQTLAYMVIQGAKVWSPSLFTWYEENRAGKGKLAP